MAGLDWLTARPIAHRGLHDRDQGRLENTESAFAAAIAGDFAIECDIQLSADGEAMVFHDYSLDRLTGEKGRVAERTAAQLKAISLTASRDRIPTLAEVIEQVDGRVPLIVEIKSQWREVGRLEARAAEIAGAHPGPIALMSFNPESVAAVRAARPWLPRGIVGGRFRNVDYWNRFGLDGWQRFRMRHMLHGPRTRPHFIAYDIDGLPAAAPLISKWLVGAPLLAWTVRSKAACRRVMRYADQVIFEGFLPERCDRGGTGLAGEGLAPNSSS